MPLLPALAVLLPLLHLPHDDVHAVAVGPGPNGGLEIVLASNSHVKFLRSTDLGLSWSTIAGDGLGFTQGTAALYWNHPTDPRFFLGTRSGVWTVRPGAQAVAARDGLPADDRTVAALAAPANGSGPVLLVTTGGRVLAWDEAAASWQLLLTTGDADLHAQIAVCPDYDPNAPPGPQRMILAGIAGRLWMSKDGGRNWVIHPRFAAPAAGPDDWWITGLAFASDFAASGGIVLGRGRDDPAAATGTAGELWRSGDFGGAFVRVQGTDSAVRALAAAGPGPAGRHWFFAACEAIPEPGAAPMPPGVLRSADGGVHWDDAGNHQDFFLENERETAVALERARDFGFAVSPAFAADGRLFLGRQSGLYAGEDQGAVWHQVAFRSAAHVRDLDLGTDAAGDLVAFAGAYGSGLVRTRVDSGTTTLLDGPLFYNRSVAVSAHFARDGAVGLAGEGGVAFWLDPAGGNAFGRTGWLWPVTPRNPRALAFHPTFDLGPPPLDGEAILAWSTWAPDRIFLSGDGGRHVFEVSRQLDGSPMPPVLRMEIAPTCGSASPADWRDVYAIAGPALFRLTPKGWLPLGAPGGTLINLALDPGFRRPEAPRLFVAEQTAPRVWQVLDREDGPVWTALPRAGLEGEIRDLAVPPDFDRRPVLYASTWGTGVVRIDLAAPRPAWEPVGGPFPEEWCEPIRLPRTFALDRRIVVGTQSGLVVGEDRPGAPWRRLPAPYTVEDSYSGLRWYDPNHPANPQPDRVWPWQRERRRDLPGLSGLDLVGLDLSWCEHDGARLEWRLRARRVELRTLGGPGLGSVTVELFDPGSGQVLAAVGEDLGRGSVLEPRRVGVELAGSAEVGFRAVFRLDPGERAVVDGLTVFPD